MMFVSAWTFYMLLGLFTKWSHSYLNNRPFPTYSLEKMPDTQFSCREKILGGYYADPDTQCQMFHVCVKVAGIGVQDFRFLCPNGTAFDQDHQICAEWEDVDCDASTLYYSSDNFDLYRIGSGFESKAVKYGEDEETFALQRAETGDIRLNREPQTQVVNQQQELRRPQYRKNFNNNNYNNNNNNNNNNQERDIFKASSSSNFFNNRNNGKENDEDYDDNVNFNQNREYQQNRKVIRKQQTKTTEQNNSFSKTTQPSNNGQQQRSRSQRLRNNAVANQRTNAPASTPSYTISTPTPFKQSPSSRSISQYDASNRSSTENYPQQRPTTFRSNNFDVHKTSVAKQTDNYPSNNPLYSKSTAPAKSPVNSQQFDVNRVTTFSPSAKPFSFSNSGQSSPSSSSSSGTFPSTFAPRTQQAFTQIAQKTSSNTNFYSQKTNSVSFTQQNPTTFTQQQQSTSTTQRSSGFTQYTPTVPKIATTTPVSRSNRFDETEYDDGSYNPKYDYNNGGADDEFLKTAHSQNIASSRNELLKSEQRSQQQQQQQNNPQKNSSTQKQQQYETTRSETERSYSSSTSKQPDNYLKSTQLGSSSSSGSRNTQRPVSVQPTASQTRPKHPQNQQPQQTKQQTPPKTNEKKVKDVSYDYAYYDSLASEPDYQLDLDIKKSSSDSTK